MAPNVFKQCLAQNHAHVLCISSGKWQFLFNDWRTMSGAWQVLLIINCLTSSKVIAEKSWNRRDFLKINSTVDIGLSQTSPSNHPIDQEYMYNLSQPLRAGILQYERTIKWDSMYEIDKDGNFKFLPGMSGIIWNYVSRHSGLSFITTKVMSDWGSLEVSSLWGFGPNSQ